MVVTYLNEYINGLYFKLYFTYFFTNIKLLFYYKTQI